MSIQNPGAQPSNAPSPEESAQEVIESVGEETEQIESAESVDLEEASDQDLADVVEDENSTDEEIEQAQAEIARRISMKINGVEEEFDLGNDDHIERLKEMAQKGEGADRKFQEAAALRKQMEAFVQLMQDNPIEALKRIGHDPDALAEKHMQARIDEMQKSPEQLEREALQKELEDLRKERERIEQEKVQAERQAAQEAYSRQLDNDITEALDKSTLPKSPLVVKRIAEYLAAGLQKNPKISVKDVMPIVERQVQKDVRDMFGKMSEDMIEQIIGKEFIDKVRKKRIAKMKNPVETASSVKSTGKSEINASAPKADPKPVSAKDFFSDFGDL
jgi:hypothetical protein